MKRSRWITVCGILLGMNIVLSLFGIPVPGGHFYLCDVVITIAALILDPLGAFIVGGVGSFIGDMLFNPPSMYVSLVVHGLQALSISLIVRHAKVKEPEYLALIVGTIIMVFGYTIGRTFVYSTLTVAIMKLPYEIIQGLGGSIVGIFLVKKMKLKEFTSK